MKETDTPKLNTVAQQEIRYQVIRLKKQSRKRLEIIDIAGIHPSTISVRWKLYKNGGRTILKIKKYFKHPKISYAGAAI